MLGPSLAAAHAELQARLPEARGGHAWETAMPSIPADGNVEGHLKALVHILENTDWRNLASLDGRGCDFRPPWRGEGRLRSNPVAGLPAAERHLDHRESQCCRSGLAGSDDSP